MQMEQSHAGGDVSTRLKEGKWHSAGWAEKNDCVRQRSGTAGEKRLRGSRGSGSARCPSPSVRLSWGLTQAGAQSSAAR